MHEVSLVIFAFALIGCSGDDEGNGGTSEPYPPPAPDDCIQDVTPGHQTLTCDGLSFELSVGDVCLHRACGLIVDTHGFGMNGELMDLHSHLRALGNPAGYIVVNPSSPGTLGSSSWTEANDDQVFAFMQRVINVWHVNPKKIHFTGYSQGGWMTWRFACKHADMIASIAPLAAGTSCTFSATQPSRELPIFYVHGTTDGLVPFATAVAQRDAVIAAWGFSPTEIVSSGSDHEWTRYTNENGNVFEFAQHNWETSFMLGGLALRGHCVPGSGEFRGCGADTAFNWGESVLSFFQRHPLP